MTLKAGKQQRKSKKARFMEKINIGKIVAKLKK